MSTIDLTYDDCAALSRRLADRIRALLGARVGEAALVPIPRGGLIVGGLLAYHLELQRHQIADPRAVRAPLVILVDDCVLSGARLAGALDEITAPEIVVAHLASHSALRAAVLAAEPRVRQCMAALDLDLEERALRAAPAAPPALATLPGRRYWMGRTRPVAFPWRAPQSHLTGRSAIAGHWRRGGPLTIEARRALSLPILDDDPPGLVPGGDLLWRLVAEGVELLDQRDGSHLRLEGSAALMWRLLLAYNTASASVQTLAACYDAPAEQLTDDLAGFRTLLLERGLLETAGDPPGR